MNNIHLFMVDKMCFFKADRINHSPMFKSKLEKKMKSKIRRKENRKNRIHK